MAFGDAVLSDQKTDRHWRVSLERPEPGEDGRPLVEDDQIPGLDDPLQTFQAVRWKVDWLPIHFDGHRKDVRG